MAHTQHRANHSKSCVCPFGRARHRVSNVSVPMIRSFHQLSVQDRGGCTICRRMREASFQRESSAH
eukprot:scaffold149040_cov62-Cyclotella_meneghiniana.AAC.5